MSFVSVFSAHFLYLWQTQSCNAQTNSGIVIPVLYFGLHQQHHSLSNWAQVSCKEFVLIGPNFILSDFNSMCLFYLIEICHIKFCYSLSVVIIVCEYQRWDEWSIRNEMTKSKNGGWGPLKHTIYSSSYTTAVAVTAQTNWPDVH